MAAPLQYCLFPSSARPSTLIPYLCVSVNSVQIARTLDPEPGPSEAFVSVGRILRAARIPVLDGIKRFNIENLDVQVGGLAPFEDIWVDLAVARRVASALGLESILSNLLHESIWHIWSLDDGEDAGVLHNWRIATDLIASNDYSTGSMLHTSFEVSDIQILRNHVRVPVSKNDFISMKQDLYHTCFSAFARSYLLLLSDLDIDDASISDISHLNHLQLCLQAVQCVVELAPTAWPIEMPDSSMQLQLLMTLDGLVMKAFESEYRLNNLKAENTKHVRKSEGNRQAAVSRDLLVDIMARVRVLEQQQSRANPKSGLRILELDSGLILAIFIAGSLVIHLILDALKD